METFVLTTTAIGSFGALPLQSRARAFYVLFLHALLTLTVGSLTFRALSGGGILLIPFIDGWHSSPTMHLNAVRAYSMLAVSLFCFFGVLMAKARIIWLAQTNSGDSSFTASPYCCLTTLWVHLAAILLLILC